MAKVGPFPLSTPPVYPGVYLITGWATRPGREAYARYNGQVWEYGGSTTAGGATCYPGLQSITLNDPSFRRYEHYRWYGVDEATSKGTA